ncbi:MAG: AMP-binding protein [Dehalococcoidia bacterium]
MHTVDSLDEILSPPPLREQLWRRFEEQPSLPALHVHNPHAPGGGRWLTYEQLGRAVNRTAHAIAAAGAAPGIRVGVMLPNSEMFVYAWLALVALNATMVPVNPDLVGASLRHIVLNADLDLLLFGAPLLQTVREACGGAPPARRVLVIDLTLGPRPSGEAGDGVQDFGTLLDVAPETPPPLVAVDPADLALIIYTSGTTGPPKGVMLSRLAQLWHGLNYLRDFIQLGPGDAGYTPLPLFHVSAQGFTLGCLLGGAAVAVDNHFHPFSFWDAVRRYRAKAFNYVGAMIPLLSARPPRPDDADNPAERAVGSATLPELHESFERRFALRLIESYGQTEMAGLWLTDPPNGRRIGTVGRPRRWLEAAMLRNDGTVAAHGETGEIALRPAHPLLMTHGYFRDPETTAHAFRGGWYHTGDAGVRDADGYVRFRGRLKDFIRRRGENISAFEIEREALTHPAVREAAAVGIPSPLGEEEIKLCVIPREGATVDPADLDRHLGRRLARFMRPRYIEIRTDFPRTPTQRVQKFTLREEGVGAGAWERRSRGGRQRHAAESGEGP